MLDLSRICNRFVAPMVLLVLGLALGSAPSHIWAASTAELENGGAGSTQTAVDQHGNVHRWTAEAGAITIVDFAASWCGPCHETLPKLQAFADQHPEIRVLVISVDEKEKDRDALVKDLGLTLPVLWDRDHQAAESYRPEGMPSTFVFDAAGKPVMSYAGSGSDDWRALTQAVDRLLAQSP